MSKRSTTVKVIGAICVIGVVGGLGISVKIKGQSSRRFKQYEKVMEKEFKEACPITQPLKEKEIEVDEEAIYVYVETLIEEYNRENLAIIEMSRQHIEHDLNERYMVNMQVIGSDDYMGVSVYDYYIILSKQDDQYHVMPLGIEVIKDDQDPMKRDLILSMLKTANGWGLTQEQSMARYEVLLEEAGRKNVQELSKQQRIVKFINYAIQERVYELNKEQDDLKVELIDLEVVDIVKMPQSDNTRVHVEGHLVLCTNTLIESAKITASVDVIEEADRFKIVNSDMKINKITKK